MFPLTDGIDPSQFKERQDENESFVFMKSRFNFINDHKGLRPGCVHVLLSTTGGGKSTLVMSLVDEMLRAGKNIFLYSSEETAKDFETKMSYWKSSGNEKNLRIFHEKMALEAVSGDLKNVDEFLNQLKLGLIEHQPDVFIFDNITTSLFYDQNEGAIRVAVGLKRLAEFKNIPFLIVAHTTSSVSQSEFFESSKIRGFRSIVNTAEYVYCLMRFRVEECGWDRDISVVYTDKSRNHPVASRAFYRMFYDGAVRLFTSDEKIKYEVFRGYLRGSA